jgi:hypothetical protein
MTRNGKPPALTFERAMKLLRKPGYTLVQTNTKHGREFSVVPGGRVTDMTARRLLQHRTCHPVDRGLFPAVPQSWSLYFEEESNAP